jgi:hypothetical protein
MKIAMIHLSDIHIESATAPVLTRVQSIIAAGRPLFAESDAMILVVSGDIAFSGQASQYEIAYGFFTAILQSLRQEAPPSVVVYPVFVPGNHDGLFKGESGARAAIITGVSRGAPIDDSIIEICTAPQREYFKFTELFDSQFRTYSDSLWVEHDINLGGYIVSFSAINVSWMSQVPETQGKLIFPIERYTQFKDKVSDLRIAVIHHPLNWYAQETYHPFRTLCQEQYRIIMSGHEHVPLTSTVTDRGGSTMRLEAGALDPHGDTGTSTFSIVAFDLERDTYQQKEYVWDGRHYEPPSEDTVWSIDVPMPTISHQEWALTSAIIERLGDAGAKFSHPKKETITLSDVFVWPDVEVINCEKKEDEKYISSEILAEDLESFSKIIFRGEDQYGKTSLLHSLYINARLAGYVPLLLSGAQLAGESDERLYRKIKDAVTFQYGSGASIKFDQLEKSKKLFLVDDLDVASLQRIGKVLRFLGAHANRIAVTVSERFDVVELMSGPATERPNDFKQFRILGFGYKSRRRLVEKWYRICRDDAPDSSEQEFQTQVSSSERVINSYIRRGLIPPTAFNVLILLQSMEARVRSTLPSIGIAGHYDFMIQRELTNADVRDGQLDEYFSYMTELAWYFHVRQSRTMDESQLRDFNDFFSVNFHPTDLANRIQILTKSGILKII